MSIIHKDVVTAAAAHQMPPPLVQALLRNLSGCLPFYGIGSKECEAAIKKTPPVLDRVDMITALLVAPHTISAFEFDQATWDQLGTIAMSPDLRFQMSCKLGITKLTGKSYIFSTLNTANPPKFEEWGQTLKEFMSNVPKQIDLLLFQLENLSTPKTDKDSGGIMLGISRLYHPDTDKVMPIAREILAEAKKIDLIYKDQLERERRFAQSDAARLRSETQKAVC